MASTNPNQSSSSADESQLRLFGRVVSLVVAAQPTGFIGSNPGFFESVGNGVEITDLRIQFEIKKSLGKEPNTCKVIISNLAKSSRLAFQKLPLYATLSAGHDGVARHLFSGNVTRGFSEHKGTEWETTLQIADGSRAFQHARMVRSYKPPISVKQVIADAASSMGLKLPPEIEQSNEMSQALANGISCHGPTRDVLTRLLAPYGFGWSIQNGRLQCLSDEMTTATSGWVVDQDAGMIEVPELSLPSRPTDPSELTVKNLLYPEITPGGQIDLQSESTNGVYKVNDVSHKGDTHGKDWETTIKGLLLGQSKRKGKK